MQRLAMFIAKWDPKGDKMAVVIVVVVFGMAGLLGLYREFILK